MNAIEAWKSFWFGPVSPYPLAVFRIGFGLTMLINLVGQYLPFYELFYTNEAIVRSDLIYALKWRDQPIFDLMLFLPGDDLTVRIFLYFTILMALFLTMGLFTRVSTLIFFFCLLSLNNHCPIILHAGDNYARLVSLFLVFAPSGQVLSLDSILAKEGDEDREQNIVPVAMRLIQVQFCFIYLINWYYKMKGAIWTEGSAVYYATRLTQYYRLDYPFFLDNPVASKLLTWSTLSIELALVFLLWPKKTRYYFIVIGVLFHLGLDLTFNLGLFEWFFIVTFLLFVEGSVYEKALKKMKTGFSA